jgi:hypothetical protein
MERQTSEQGDNVDGAGQGDGRPLQNSKYGTQGDGTQGDGSPVSCTNGTWGQQFTCLNIT